VGDREVTTTTAATCTRVVLTTMVDLNSRKQLVFWAARWREMSDGVRELFTREARREMREWQELL
jgi:hypothetical protein